MLQALYPHSWLVTNTIIKTKPAALSLIRFRGSAIGKTTMYNDTKTAKDRLDVDCKLSPEVKLLSSMIEEVKRKVEMHFEITNALSEKYHG